jgi:hypothetical protein
VVQEAVTKKFQLQLASQFPLRSFIEDRQRPAIGRDSNLDLRFEAFVAQRRISRERHGSNELAESAGSDRVET